LENIQKTKKRILFVIPLYGSGVSGGAESHAKQIAERLTDDYDVEVATTKAQSYVSWDNFYDADLETQNKVKIRRFKTDITRSSTQQATETLLFADPYNKELGMKWIIDQGPYSTDLIKYVRQNHKKYSKIIIFQYLYATTYFAIKYLPPEKVVFVPLAHDEPILKFEIFRRVFQRPECIIYNTQAEKDVVKLTHFIEDKKYTIAGVGVENLYELETEKFKKVHGLDNYVIYVGRIDSGKNVHNLVNYFLKYKEKHPSDLKLALAGKKIIDIPVCEHIVELGYLSEKEKFEAIDGSIALINPSPYESLSLIVLEAFLQRKPVLVNGYCDVLKYHCIDSNAGLWFENEEDFEVTLKYLLDNPEQRQIMGDNGYNYVTSKYNWDTVMQKWKSVLETH
jgi:glycosyltransferase involved in cell wall biosynthesis